jgi:thioredoxin
MAIIQMNENNFQEIIENNDIVLIDFWAPWCAPCRAFAPVFEKAAAKHENIAFAKVNTDEEQGLGAAFNIHSIPTLMIFREKTLLFAQPGMLPANVLEELIGKVEALDMDEVRKAVAEAEKKEKESQAAAPAS